MASSVGRRIPVATYRLQLRREFPFAAATALVPYANALGISDYYCSPIFLSTPGSSHGYDVNDYRRVDPELGGRRGLGELHGALKEWDMGLLLDFVPNHMGINGPGLLNTWWRDVLQNGEHSPYARFFDIDWNSGAGDAGARVLVPILDDHYGRVLEAGRLSLVYESGELAIAYGDMRFPVAPHTYQRVIESISAASGRTEELQRLAQGFATLPKSAATEDPDTARIRAARLNELLHHVGALLDTDPGTRGALEAKLSELNRTAGDATESDALNDVLEQQHYRLAFWRAGVHETNYRRFFAIDTLIGLRVEIPEVFAETHALLAQLLREEAVMGVRIDHIDGLRDPEQYLRRLQALVPPENASADPLYVVVEKILAENEALPPEWAAHGTTGYEFISELAGLLVDSRSERTITSAYASFCGETEDFEEVVYEKKRLVLEELFANAVSRLASNLTDMLQADRRWRDVTRHELTVAVREVMAAHGVYRTYRQGVEPMAERDRRIVEQASAVAMRRNRRMGTEPFELVRDVLTGAYPPQGTAGELRARLSDWVLNFQQYTGAVMAKAVEDTAFYTYSRFIALNEVGGHPGRFGGTVSGFHASNVERARRAPHNLLATGTHDTKLGEDVRARLYALSEIPHEWNEAIRDWRELNQRHKTIIDGRSAPDANEEYRIYQVLLGAWPAHDDLPDDTFRERVRDHLRKAVNEARRNTTWIQPNEDWLRAGDHFIDAILNEESGREFLGSFRPRARRLAHLGMVNSLTQIVLKTLSPGVPDFYQGSELWDLSLVDPDNRRPVDYPLRARFAAKPAEELNWVELLRNWRDGEIKLQVTRKLLSLRREYQTVFQSQSYQPLETSGRFAEHAVAFARSSGGVTVWVVVPRLTSRLGCPPLGLVWDDTKVKTPELVGRWRDALTGRTIESAPELKLADILVDLPFAVLVNVRASQ
jgi:(1->4)-alpha-D-glucan 1-alpha-D-glucosylmutase